MAAHRRVGLLGLFRVEREDDEAVLVGLQTLNVAVERLLRAVLPAVVNGDADGESLAAVDASKLELLKGEAAASSDAHVVADGGASDSRANVLGGSDTIKRYVSVKGTSMRRADI